VARAKGSQRRGARVAAGLEMTRGSYPSRKLRQQSCSGGEWRQPATAERGQLRRTAERRGVLGEGQQEGGEAVGQLGGDAWSGAGAGGSLGRRGRCGRTA
jgi:hypothetical protein